RRVGGPRRPVEAVLGGALGDRRPLVRDAVQHVAEGVAGVGDGVGVGASRLLALALGLVGPVARAVEALEHDLAAVELVHLVEERQHVVGVLPGLVGGGLTGSGLGLVHGLGVG